MDGGFFRRPTTPFKTLTEERPSSHWRFSRSAASSCFSKAFQAQGVRCWFDEKAILPGDRIRDSIDEGIRIHEKTVLVCSRNSLTSWWVDKEIELTLMKEREDWQAGKRSVRLLPITIDDFVYDGWKSGHKASILELHVGDFRKWEDPDEYKVSLERLLKALDQGSRPLSE